MRSQESSQKQMKPSQQNPTRQKAVWADLFGTAKIMGKSQQTQPKIMRPEQPLFKMRNNQNNPNSQWINLYGKEKMCIFQTADFTFKSDFDFQTYSQSLTQTDIQNLQDFAWKVDKSSYWKVVMENLQATKVSEISFYETTERIVRTEIIKLLPRIDFTLLRSLSLSNCRLLNIEFIQELNGPEMVTLFLSHNFIIETRSLRKGQLPKLTTLFIDSNYINEIPCDAYFTTSQLQVLKIHQTDHERIQLQNVDFQSKLKRKISQYSILSKRAFLSIQGYRNSQQRIKTRHVLNNKKLNAFYLLFGI